MIVDFNDVEFLYNESICGFVPRHKLSAEVFRIAIKQLWTVEENTVVWKTALANKLQNTLPLTRTTFYGAG